MSKKRKTKSKNKALLYELLQIYSPSGEEDEVASVIIRELDKLGFTYERDIHGNISAVRGIADSYPLLNAHMDIVDLSYSYGYYKGSKSYKSSDDLSYYDKVWGTYGDSEADFLIDELGVDLLEPVISCEDCISRDYCWGTTDIGDLCSYVCLTKKGEQKLLEWADKYDLLDDVPEVVERSKYFISEKDGKIKGSGDYRVLGGDDKCGIFIALEVARQTNIPMKLLFTVEEEIGCFGIDSFIRNNKSWFNDIKYSITIDRKGGDHLLMSQLGVQSCSKGFGAKVAMAGILEGIPVKVQDGSISDVIYIRDIVKNAINISAGYHDPHSEDEYVVWAEVLKIIKWVKRIVLDKNI